MHRANSESKVENVYDYYYTSTAHFTTFMQVHASILRHFAGCPTRGVFSPSVQQTMYDTEKTCLEKVHQIEEIAMAMPNK